MKKGKKYQDSVKLLEKGKLYDTDEAFELVCKTATAKFDETVELHAKLGVDSRHADEAKAAGADYVGAEDLAQKIQTENWFDFDVVVATPDMMGVVGRIGRILGPKGLMPNPKAGTVTPDVTRAIQEIKSGKIEYRLDKSNIIHCPIGKASFGAKKLTENFDALMSAIIKAKPAAAKGQYLKSVSVASTMGPGIKLNPGKLI